MGGGKREGEGVGEMEDGREDSGEVAREKRE